MEIQKEYMAKLSELIRPKTFPIGIKLLKSADEDYISKMEKVRRPKEEIALCQLFSYARFYGWTILGTKEDNLCPAGEVALGFEKTPASMSSGAMFYGRYQGSLGAAKKMSETIPRIEEEEFSALLAAPLNRFKQDPDLVLIYGNSAQMMRLIHGSLWKDGGRLYFGSSGEAVCADSVAKTYITQKPQLGIPCYGERRFGLTGDDELVMGIPYKMMGDVIEGLEKTHKSGTRYPIPVQLSTPKVFLMLKPKDKKPPL